MESLRKCRGISLIIIWMTAIGIVVFVGSTAAVGQTCQTAPVSTPVARAMAQLAAGTLEGEPIRDLKDDLVIRPGHAYVLQLEEPLSPEMKREIYATGAALVEAYPGNAFLAYLDRADAQRLSEIEFISLIAEYRREWKLSSGLTDAQGEVPVTISVFGWHPSDEAVRTVVDAGGAVLSNRRVLTQHVIGARVPAGALAELTGLTSVAYVSEGALTPHPGATIATVELATQGPPTASHNSN